MKDVDAALLALRTTGIALMEPLGRIEAIHAHFLRHPVYVDAHMPQTARTRGEGPFGRMMARARDSECICAPMEVTITAPELFEFGLSLRELAQKYLGPPHVLAYSMNAFWTRAGNAAIRPDIQDFHRDEDDPAGFLAVFFYLTDVLEDADGPHALEGPDGVVRPVFGPAGTCFVADTRNRHMGMKPARGERGIAWFRWGVSDPPPSYLWDKNEPISAEDFDFHSGATYYPRRYPADPVLQDAVRLLVR